MRQLTGLDASFLYMETANAPMHISVLGIYDQSTVPGGKLRFKEIIDNVQNRMLALPTMTQRLMTVPFEMDHPYWVTDGTFYAEFPIRHIALPKPGDWRQLCILVSRLHSRPLDRSRPLWEMYVIEGLDNVEGCPKGSFAMFTKTHHAAVDGTSGAEMTMAVHDLSADYRRERHPVVINVDNRPSTAELMLRSSLNTIRNPFNFLSVVRNTMPGMAKAVVQLSRGNLRRVKNVPRTRFNGSVSPHRVFDAINVPGPPIPLYSTGAKLVANYGTGPVGDGLGLFHLIGSYCGQFVISATSCRLMMPDPAFYRQCLQDSFDDMLKASNLK